jgi:hypothetical protein
MPVAKVRRATAPIGPFVQSKNDEYLLTKLTELDDKLGKTRAELASADADLQQIFSWVERLWAGPPDVRDLILKRLATTIARIKALL